MPVIHIDPVTRLEGHGRIDLELNAANEVEHAWLKIPELRGFEEFLKGRPVEDMPQITSRICGVCPSAHHMAATKALDHVYQVEPPPAARRIRELFYNTFFVEDHALHFYFLAGPDFLVGPTAPKAERNILGLIARIGVDEAKKVIAMRTRLREVLAMLGGKAIHPVLGLPGGVAKRVTADEQGKIQAVAADAVAFALASLDIFDQLVLKNPEYLALIRSEAFTHRTYSMGLVDAQNRVSFYDGDLRVVGPEGKEFARFAPSQYLDHLAERVEPWTYMKVCYLKRLGWRGYEEGEQSGVYSVAPLARLNASEGMPTPLAQTAYARFYDTLGAKPVHYTLANHWARLIEMLSAAERMKELADNPELPDSQIRTIPSAVPGEGVGVVEAPRGTLIHHYWTDGRGMVKKANLIVATQHNAARIQMSIEKAAKALIRGPEIREEMLNYAEMAFRAYDPCFGCATHAIRLVRKA